MGKLILSIYMSLDGYTAGLHNDLDWLPSSEGTSKFGIDILEHASAILLGGNTYRMFEAYWPAAETNPSTYPPDIPLAQRINALPKYVVSKSLTTVHWNATIIRSNMLAEVARLKQSLSGDIVMHGGAMLAQSLMEARLFDEYHIQISPAVLGKGKRLFNDQRQPITLLGVKDLDGQFVDLHYRTNPKARGKGSA